MKPITSPMLLQSFKGSKTLDFMATLQNVKFIKKKLNILAFLLDNMYPISTGFGAYAENNPTNFKPLLTKGKFLSASEISHKPTLGTRPAHFLQEISEAETQDPKLAEVIKQLKDGKTLNPYS
ncbi:hypothetical protein OIO90_006615 [Microbotryomycetes sp. JL221]|nr:hypothetical protein OIO90_006615 [Microbotryomycetes sp. JL221]